jgi:hypothetical protein
METYFFKNMRVCTLRGNLMVNVGQQHDLQRPTQNQRDSVLTGSAITYLFIFVFVYIYIL